MKTKMADFEITDEIIEQWAEELFKNEQNDLKCPPEILVIAYANDELEGDVQKAIDAHLDYCTSCLDLMLSVRAARAEAQDAEPPVLPEKLLQAVESAGKDELPDYSQAKVMEFQKPVPVSAEKLASWFAFKPEGSFALAAQDTETGRRILLKIIKMFSDSGEKLFAYELEVIDELYDAGELHLIGRVQEKCVIEKLVACYAAWAGRDGDETKNSAYRCQYDPESGLLNLSFKCDEIPESGIKQIVCICE